MMSSTLQIPPGKWGHEYYVSMLRGSLLNYVGELPAWNIISTDAFKSIVSGDAVMGREPYGLPCTFTPRAAQIFGCNELPATKDYSHGFWRRFQVIPFVEQFDGAVTIPEILARFAHETPGIVAWAMVGAVRLMAQRGYSKPLAVRAAKQDWTNDADAVKSFLTACCDESGSVRTIDLYQAFRQWCDMTGRAATGDVKFGRGIKRLGIAKRHKTSGRCYMVGLKPVTDWEVG